VEVDADATVGTIMIDFLITFAILLVFIGEPIYNTGFSMKFRIVEKHSGKDYYYIIQQRWFLSWRQPFHPSLEGAYWSCKEAMDSIDAYELMIKTNDVILEKTI